jgi:hypothetical protein
LDTIRRVVLARDVAQRWVEEQALPEHRVTVYYMGKYAQRLPNILRSFRDGKFKIASVGIIPDLGVNEGFDSVILWSRDAAALAQLCRWCEQQGFETTGLL